MGHGSGGWPKLKAEAQAEVCCPAYHQLPGLHIDGQLLVLQEKVLNDFIGWSISCSVTSSPLLLQMSKPPRVHWDDNVLTCPGKGQWDTSQRSFHLTTLVCRTGPNNHSIADTGVSKTCLPKGSWSSWRERPGASEGKRNGEIPSTPGNPPHLLHIHSHIDFNPTTTLSNHWLPTKLKDRIAKRLREWVFQLSCLGSNPGSATYVAMGNPPV